jgi:hypothetical protein
MNPQLPTYAPYANPWMNPNPNQMMQGQMHAQMQGQMQGQMPSQHMMPNQFQLLQAAALLQQQRMPFGFQPVYNHSSMMSMPHQTRHPQRRNFQTDPRLRRMPEEIVQNPEEEVEIQSGEQVDHVEEALQNDPNFLQKVDQDAVNTEEPNVFKIDLEVYPLAAWKKIDAKVASAQHYKQWFNYGLTPRTFGAYATQQKIVQESLKNLY